MKTLAERLVWARLNKSTRDGADLTQTDLAHKAGVSQGAIGHLESGRTGTSRSITAIARALEVNPAWLVDGKGHPFDGTALAAPPAGTIAGAMRVVAAERDDPDLMHIRKVQLRVSAGVTGFRTDAEFEDGGTLALDPRWIAAKKLKPQQLIAITVKGDSMEPGLYDGDVVVINTADTKHADGGVFVFNYEGEVVIKRLSRDIGEWWLSSDNPDQRKFHRKLCRAGECIVVGRVVRKESDRI